MAATDRGFIDVNACFGPEHGIAEAAAAPLSALLEERRRHGVRLALAHSLLATRADPRRGNRLALDLAEDPANGLAAVAVVGPAAGDGTRSVDEWSAAGACAFRVEGWIGSAPPGEATRELLTAVAATGRPMLVPLSSTGPLHGFGEASAIGAATARLGIPVVLVGAHYNHIVDDLAAVARYPHLYLETSAMGHFRAIETAVATIGHERLLLGTGSAARPGASAICAVLLARITDEAKRAILAGNAARLFGLSEGPVDLALPALPSRAWDVHTHYGPFGFGLPPIDDDALNGELLTGLAGANTASSAVGIFGDPAAGNDQARAAADEARGQFSWVVADPHDLAFTEGELRRHLHRPGVLGVKVHGQVSGVPTASRRMRDLFDLLAGFGRPVKIHNEGDDWDDALLEIAHRHPALPIVIAHGGLGTPSEAAGRLAASAERIYFELSSSFASRDQVRRAVALAPVERILWGSDASLLDPGFVYGTYEDAGLPDNARDRVFWTNAVELFGV
jgi:uncharacterized protein